MSEALAILAELADKRQIPQALELNWEKKHNYNPVAVVLEERRKRHVFLLRAILIAASFLVSCFVFFSFAGSKPIFLVAPFLMGAVLFLASLYDYWWGRRSYNPSPMPAASRSEIKTQILGAETFANDLEFICTDLPANPWDLCIDGSELKEKVRWTLSYYAKCVLEAQDRLSREKNQNEKDKFFSTEQHSKTKLRGLHFVASRLGLAEGEWDVYFEKGQALLDDERQRRHDAIAGLQDRVSS